jgi:hypothetical protein
MNESQHMRDWDGLRYNFYTLPRATTKRKSGTQAGNMSLKSKFKRWIPFQQPLLEVPPATDVPPKERAQIAQLIANGNLGHAVDIAKQVHRRLGNAASEELLVGAYATRIISLAERDLDAEASALLELVQARHPSSRERLREVAATLKARGRGIEGLLELLVDPSLPTEKRAGVEARIRGAAGDPTRISRCDALPPEHALRVAAGAVGRALEAVTSGPVAAESLALPEISRTSPMAPWKMMLRAIQAFYGNQDELCEKYLAAVEPTAAAARLVPAVREMIGQKQRLSPAAVELVKQAGGGLATLKSTLVTLDQALGKNNQALGLQQMGKAVTLCKEVCPDLVERLKQHISVGAMMAGAKPDRVVAAIGGPSLKNAYFWRLLARAYEETPHDPVAIPIACSVWEEFRKHAVHEKWFPASGPEIATLYLHMTELWRHVPEDEAESVKQRFAATFRGHRDYYAGQPAEIRALMPAPGWQDRYYLHEETLYGRACEADPCSENFQRWLNWAKQNEFGHDNQVAERWAAVLPHDITPVLHQMQWAEKTNAFKKAFGLMERAERLDGLNPEVRKARLRLLISLATRHLQQKKTRLAEPELRQIEALPQAQQGDRPALAAALRWVFWTLAGDASKADAARATVVRVLGSEAAAQIVLQAVAGKCRFKGEMPGPGSARGPLAAALGRACALGEDTGVPIKIPQVLSGPLMRELSGKDPVADAAGLGALGEAAVRGVDLDLAYAVSAAGLKLGQERWAEFLFLRARALPEYAEERQALCAAAASELARRQRNADLLGRIGKWREGALDWERNEADVAMTTQQIDDLVRQEREQPEVPDMDDMQDDMQVDGGLCDCPSCRAARDGMPPGMPSGMPPVLERLMEELGPEDMMRALEQIFGGGPKRRRRRSRPVFGDDEAPF